MASRECHGQNLEDVLSLFRAAHRATGETGLQQAGLQRSRSSPRLARERTHYSGARGPLAMKVPGDTTPRVIQEGISLLVEIRPRSNLFSAAAHLDE